MSSLESSGNIAPMAFWKIASSCVCCIEKEVFLTDIFALLWSFAHFRTFSLM